MPKYSQYVGETIFRYVDGVCRPMRSKEVLRKHSQDHERKVTPTYNYDSFVNPNTLCPVCGQEVFYYQSTNGSRVFFDALGPPWPKHPCTDNPSFASSVAINIEKPTPQADTNRKTYDWQKTGWEPFYVIEIKEVKNNYYVSIYGEFKREKITIYVRNDGKFPEQPLIHLRKKDNKSYDLSTISGLLERKYIAYTSLLVAYRPHSKPQNKKSNSCSKISYKEEKKEKPPKTVDKKPLSNKTKQKNAMEIAFEKASITRP